MPWTAVLLILALTAAPTPVKFTVDGVGRESLVHLPEAATGAAPVVFVFHGHGGNSAGVAGRFRVHESWPEAIVVYPQGLPTATRLDPAGVKPGWQTRAGDEHDRDLKFFDEMLSTIKARRPIDPTRIYATGHSNGGGFTYQLWATRHEVLAAVAPSSTAGGGNLQSLRPLPALHVAGKQDAVAPFALQQRTMEAVRQVNHCSDTPRPYGADGALYYPSETQTPFVSLIHPGGHAFPASAGALIVRFFKEHAKVPAATKAN